MSELRAHVPRSPDDGLAQLERFEAVYEDFFDKALLGFLNHIRRAAVDALAAPVIVASASSLVS